MSGAIAADEKYTNLVTEYITYGLNSEVQAVTAEALNAAVNGLLDIMVSIERDAGYLEDGKTAAATDSVAADSVANAASVETEEVDERGVEIASATPGAIEAVQASGTPATMEVTVSSSRTGSSREAVVSVAVVVVACAFAAGLLGATQGTASR